MIAKGRVQIDGMTASIGMRYEQPSVITIDGKPLTNDPYIYLILNKPVGYVCSRSQQGAAPTIYSLLPEKFHALKPVGRLDKDSSGLLLLTNDGDFAHTMTHPSFHKTKTYHISLDKALEPLHHQMINDIGIQLDDGLSKLQLEKQNDTRKNWIVRMHEGRNRQIRRTFNALGYTVQKLHRTEFGIYRLDSLAPGDTSNILPQ